MPITYQQESGAQWKEKRRESLKPVDGEECFRGLDLWGDSGNLRLAAPDLAGKYPELLLE